MNELLRKTANLLSMDAHVEKIEESINEYKNAKLDSEKDDAEKKLLIGCIMITYKHFDKGKKESEILKENESIQAATEISRRLQEGN